jgi:hypothetical protein
VEELFMALTAATAATAAAGTKEAA